MSTEKKEMTEQLKLAMPKDLSSDQIVERLKEINQFLDVLQHEKFSFPSKDLNRMASTLDSIAHYGNFTSAMFKDQLKSIKKHKAENEDKSPELRSRSINKPK
jgi:hypothetical protein